MKAEERKQLQALWQQRVNDWQASGLTQVEWCKAHNVKTHQLTYWKLKLISDTTPSKLIPLTAQKIPLTPAATVMIHLPCGIRLEADMPYVADLIHALQNNL